MITERRWYEKNHDTAKMVQQLEQLPDDLQHIVAETIVDLSEQKYKVLELLHSLKSLGREVIMAMYKAKNKLRELDQKPMVFKALNHMQILPKERALKN